MLPSLLKDEPDKKEKPMFNFDDELAFDGLQIDEVSSLNDF